MKKVLITANTDRHILLCHMPYIRWFKENGYTVDLATNTEHSVWGTNKINLGMKRNPFSLKNIKAIFTLKKILENEKYELIHTHTPVGSVVTRWAYKLAKSKSKLIYTCHGFHFYKKSPFYFWMLFYPIEKYLMKYTDVLLVMNDEDYNFAKKHFKNVEIKRVNGVGFNENKFKKTTTKEAINKTYKEIGIDEKSFVAIYVAEYSKRKGQIKLVKTLSKTDIQSTNIKILLIGDDTLNGEIQKTINKYGLDKNIITIDFTNEVNKFLDIADVVISVSRQEGLPLNLLEAIYKNKIIIATGCRGNIDLVKDFVNGFIINDIDELYGKIQYVRANYENVQKIYRQGIDIKHYTSEYVLNQVTQIYNEILKMPNKIEH